MAGHFSDWSPTTGSPKPPKRKKNKPLPIKVVGFSVHRDVRRTPEGGLEGGDNVVCCLDLTVNGKPLRIPVENSTLNAIVCGLTGEDPARFMEWQNNWVEQRAKKK
jgi:hypothetical protein